MVGTETHSIPSESSGDIARPPPETASLLSVSEEDAFEYACRIWFHAPGRRAANELSSLPTKEREQVWADLTGHASASNFTPLVHEDPVKVQQALSAFRQGVFQLPQGSLGSALQMKPDYICNPNYLIKFLRAKEFNIPAALECLEKHLKIKEYLFGRDSLTRDIVLDDLTTDDQNFMKRGVYQHLKEKDRAGRTVSFLHFADPCYSNDKMHSVVRYCQ
jgi:hypothetical protein